MEPSSETLYENVRKRFYEAPFVTHLGLELTHVEPDLCIAKLQVQPHHRQQDGYVHAGVLSTLADHAAGAAGWTKVKDHETVLTAEFKISFLRPAKGPDLTCEARVIRAGRRLIFTEAQVLDADGRPAARLSQTLAVAPRTGSPGEGTP